MCINEHDSGSQFKPYQRPMKNNIQTASSHPHWSFLIRTFSIVAFLLLCAGLSTGAAANFCVNPGFEDGTDTAAPPWSFWAGTGGAMPNPFVDANNPSARVWSNFGNPTYVNVAAQNEMSGVWLIPGATYHVHAQYYVPSSEVVAGTHPVAAIRLAMKTAGAPFILDDSTPAALITATDTWFTFDFDWTYPGTTIDQVDYMSFRLYGRADAPPNGRQNNPGGYFDNCQFSSAAYTGVINGVVKNSSGPLSGASVKISYKGGAVKIITTVADGVFSFADLIPGEPYTVDVTKPQYLAATRTANASANLGDIVLSPDPDFDPDAIVSLRAASLTVGADLATWPNGGNLGGTFDKFSGGTGPEVKLILGKKAVAFAQASGSAGDRRTMASATPAPASLAGNSPWTISALIYRDDATVNSENCFFEWAGRDWGTGATAQFCYRNNLAFVHFGADSGFNAVPSSGAWHYMTVTYDGLVETIYIDGAVDKTIDRSSAPLNLAANGLLIVGGATFKDMRGEDQYWRFNGGISCPQGL